MAIPLSFAPNRSIAHTETHTMSSKVIVSFKDNTPKDVIDKAAKELEASGTRSDAR